MGRTLYYKVFDDELNYREAEREIRVARELLIYRFTWTSERPSLWLLGESERYERERDLALRSPRPIPIAEGMSKILDDEWNAVLITRFLTWVSRRLPHARVTLLDEGDYLTPGAQTLLAGVPQIVPSAVAEWAAHLTERGLSSADQNGSAAIEAFTRGEIHRSIPVREYDDRSEIRVLGFAPEVLARMTLDEVADAIAFPWTTEGLGAA